MSNALRLISWRRGRGPLIWDFSYIMQSHEKWFTTPGWYRKAKTNIYRLTIDHDYPSKPLWLGVRRNQEWSSAEGLYEPLTVIHSDFVIASRNFRGASHRSNNRRWRSLRVLKTKTGSILNSAYDGNHKVSI